MATRFDYKTNATIRRPQLTTRLSVRLLHIYHHHDSFEIPFRFDEFGFRVDEEDGPEQNSSKLLGIPFVEDPQHRLQWVAYLEFSHNKELTNLTWDKVALRLPRTEKLRQMVIAGIPHSLRPQMWMRLSGIQK